MRLIAHKVLFVLILFGVAVGSPATGRSGSPAVERLSIQTAAATHEFDVEMAVTADEQRKGLMYRRHMAPDAGMLFLYDKGSQVTMWMSNTYIPLDMLFIAADGRITHIVERTVPLSTELIGSNGPVRGVLELNGGTTSRLGIKVGDKVRHRSFQ